MINHVTPSSALFLVVCFAALHGRAAAQEKPLSRTVIVNRVQLSNQEIESLERRYQIRVQEGSFWYDKTSGAWGRDGGPTVGFGVAGLSIGGPMRADASKGDTKVFINGRELHRTDVAGLQQLGPVFPGRYWVDAYGNCGVEGGPALFNLVQIARSRQQVQGGANPWTGNGGSWIVNDGNGKLSGQFKDGLGNTQVFGQ